MLFGSTCEGLYLQAAHRETRHAVLIKGGVLPVEEEKPGLPDVAVITQRGSRAVVQHLDFEAHISAGRLPGKQKTSKDLGIQTEAPRALPKAAKASLPSSAAFIMQPPPKVYSAEATAQWSARKHATSEGGPPAFIDETSSEASEATETPEAGSVHCLGGYPEAGDQATGGFQGKNRGKAVDFELAIKSEPTLESDKTAPAIDAGRQQPESWMSPAVWELMQQSMYVEMGIPNPMVPPSLQALQEAKTENVFCWPSPMGCMASASMPFAGEVCDGVTTVPDPQQVPALNEPPSKEELQQTDFPPWLLEEAAKLFPPGFEQALWENVSFAHPAVVPAVPVVQIASEDPPDPWQALVEETQWQVQWGLYRQWHRHLQRQWQAYAKKNFAETSISRREGYREKPAASRVPEKTSKRQNALKQEIYEEFETFSRTQSLLAKFPGAQCFRGRAALGNCRGGRRSWGIFDKCARTASERARQRRLALIPEADDYFRSQPSPSLRLSARKAGGLRGGLRTLFTRFDWSNSEKARTLHRRSRRGQCAAELSENPSKHLEEEFPDYWLKQLQDHSTCKRARQQKTVLDEVDECRRMRREKKDALGDSGEPVDWYERQTHRLGREAKMDKFFGEVANYSGLRRYFNDKSAELISPAISPEEEAGTITEEATVRELLPLRTIMQLKNRMYASSRLTHLERLAGLLAAEKLPRECEKFFQTGSQCSNGSQVFVGLLNVEGNQVHPQGKTYTEGGDVSAAPFEEYSGCQQSVFDIVEDTAEDPREVKSGQKEGPQEVHRTPRANCEMSASSSCSRNVSQAKPWNYGDRCEAVGSRKERACACTRGRTLLDLSQATQLEAQTTVEKSWARTHVADCDVCCEVDRFPGTRIRNSKTTPAALSACQDPEKSCLKYSASVCAESSGIDEPRLTGNRQATNAVLAGVLPQDDIPGADSFTTNEDFSHTIQTSSNGVQMTASSNDADGDTHAAGLHPDCCRTNRVNCNSVCDRASFMSEPPSTENVQLLERATLSKPLLVGRFDPLARSPFPVQTANDATASATISRSRRDFYRQACLAQTKKFTHNHSTDDSVWRKRLIQWRNETKNGPRIFPRRTRPTSFPWDEEIIPACRRRTANAIEFCAEAYHASEGVTYSNSLHFDLLKISSAAGECSTGNSKAQQQRLPSSSQEKRDKVFLIRRSGTGGGAYGRKSQRDNDQEGFSLNKGRVQNAGRARLDTNGTAPSHRESICTLVPGTSFYHPTSATTPRNASNLLRRTAKRSVCVNSVCAGEAELLTYLIEHTGALANLKNLSGGVGRI